MFDIAKLRTDLVKEREGTWLPYPGGLRLKIARMNNDEFQRAAIKRRREIQRQLRFSGGDPEAIDPDVLRTLSIEATADYILLGWEGMVEDGAQVPYTRENAIRLLTEYPDFLRLVEDASSDVSNFRLAEEEAIRGNSAGSAPGSSSGADTHESSSPSENEPA